jgi:hypothetical protein
MGGFEKVGLAVVGYLGGRVVSFQFLQPKSFVEASIICNANIYNFRAGLLPKPPLTTICRVENVKLARHSPLKQR